MSFEEEWALIRAQSAQRESDRTRLDQVNPGGTQPGSGNNLQVTPSTLNQRARQADTVRRNLASADDAAARETSQVKSGLRGFASASAFAVFQQRWSAQLTYLEGLLHQHVSAALRAAATNFATEDDEQKVNFQGKGPKAGEAN